MGQRVTETERKYEAAGDGPGPVRPPDLSGLPSVARTRDLPPVRLDAVYFDTPDLALAAHRRTLRRRTGGDDAGWHLKLPAAEADTRTEVHAPLGADTEEPPAELRTEVAAVTRGRPLLPVLRLRTKRRRVLLLDADGATLAEIAYDKVRATVLPAAVDPDSASAGPAGAPPAPSGAPRADGAGSPAGSVGTPGSPDAGGAGASAGSVQAPGSAGAADSSARAETVWAEVEVELVGGTPELLDAVEERFAGVGLRRSGAASKLGRALGERYAPLPGPPREIITAGQVVLAYLHAQLAAVLALDPAVRRAEEDAVHRMRVATRRARSALKSFRRELDRTVTDPVGAELKWLAAVLGAERDREVLAERLAVRLAELDPALVSKALRRRLRRSAGDPATHSATHSTAHAAVLRELDGPRYFALLDAFEALLAAPPYRPGAQAPAPEAATAVVRRDHRRLRDRIHTALALPPGDDRDLALHEARKDAKRARYSSEAAQPVLGEAATAHTARMKTVQQLLGEHQDSVMCRAHLAAVREQARAAGEDPAPYKALRHRERRIAADIEARLPGEWRAADQAV